MCSYTLNLCDIRNESYKYIVTETIPSNQTGIRIQIPRNNDDGTTNLNRLFYGTVTLRNSIETTVSNISISK